jgi:PhoH-like ATPase
MVERKIRPAPLTLVPRRSAKSAKSGAAPRLVPASKLFVLDTNVLMHDPTSLFRFEEHDIYLPILTLEELDNNKKGVTEVARNARQVSRFLDELVNATADGIGEGIPLTEKSGGAATGRLYLQTEVITTVLPASLANGKADNQILAVVMHLQHLHTSAASSWCRRTSTCASRRARSASPPRTISTTRSSRTPISCTAGCASFPATSGTSTEGNGVVAAGRLHLLPDHRAARRLLLVNEFLYQEKPGEQPLYVLVKEITGRTAVLQTLKDYTHQKNNVWGITARNREQNFALNLLMNPDVDFISLLGQAGTGKTLLTLAAGLMLTLELKVYSEIIMTRVTVPVGEDIGFLPGTEEEKMNPWMGALEDNLDVLNKTDDDAGEWGRAATRDLIRSRIKVKSLNFMRGRTFINKFLIIDEAQNLTPKQMKTMVTRAGPGTKVVCLGNIAQIDTPYLTEGSSGITYVVDRFKGWPHSGHVTLQRGERSRLADHAAEIL